MPDNDIFMPGSTPVFKDFAADDPFNNNFVEGRVHMEATQMYGALEIDKVNGREAKQFIWATPKMRYPFGKDTKEIRDLPKHELVQVYSKLDGTNILGFIYHDADGKEYIAYKTRLMPFLKKGGQKFGDFYSMWNELLVRYPNIPALIWKYRTVSFEMYGKKNPILIQYDFQLDTAILFAIPAPGKIMSPYGMDAMGVPVVPIIKSFRLLTVDDFAKAYWDVRDYLNQHLTIREVVAKGEDGEEIKRKLFSGLEGSVWYAVDKDNYIIEGVPFKCKPDEIFDFCTQGSIPLHAIQITIRNALEQDEPLSFELVKKLLLEEFMEDRIYARSITIQKEIDHVIEEQKFLNELAPEYMKMGFDVEKDKGTMMRYFGPKYPKKMASKIYTILLRQFGA